MEITFTLLLMSFSWGSRATAMDHVDGFTTLAACQKAEKVARAAVENSNFLQTACIEVR